MAITSILLLLPGMVAYSIANYLSGFRSKPINEVLVELALHSSFVFLFYSIISYSSCLDLIPASKILLGLHSGTFILPANALDKSIIWMFILAIIQGTVVAFDRDFGLLKGFLKRWFLFQNSALESVWLISMKSAGTLGRIEVDTKDGRRFCGILSHVSRDYEKGGILLKSVSFYDSTKRAYIPIKGSIYLRADDLRSPIIFLEAEKNQGEQNGSGSK